jgi:hypothetical protein
MFDMTLDSALFSEVDVPGNTPLYEAKMFWHFDHRWANATDTTETRIPNSIKADTAASALSRFYVDRLEVEARVSTRNWDRDWLIAYRNVSDSRNERTFVAAAIPRLGVGNSATVITIGHECIPKACGFLATLNSLVFDYAVRQKVPAMNVNVFMIEQFPILSPVQFSDLDLAFINPKAIELTYTSQSMAPFARDFGYGGPPFVWDENRRLLLRSELDAWFARAYGLTRDELRYVLDPADVAGPDYPSETFRVLKNNEIARYGEYRTARFVLAAWDAQEAQLAAAQ